MTADPAADPCPGCPPVMNSNATSLFTLGGRTTVIQCVQSGRSTSASVSHRCEVISTSVADTPSAGRSRRTFHAKLESGADTYRSSAVVAGTWRGACRWPAASSASGSTRMTGVNAGRMTDQYSVKVYKRVVARDEQVLMTVQHVRLRRCRHAVDARVPQRLAVGGVERDDVAAAVAGEHQSARRRQQTAPASAAADTGIAVPPRGLARLRIDRGQEAAAGADADLLLAAEAHRAARIRIGQVEDRIAVVLRDVEQTRVGRVRGRLPVDRAAGRGRHERSADRRILFRIFARGPPTLFSPLTQLVEDAVLARDR